MKNLTIALKGYDSKNGHKNEENSENTQKPADSGATTSLAVVNELKWMLPQEYLLDVIIDERFKVQGHLGGGFTGFVRSGRKYVPLYYFHFTLGIDLKTGKEVAIKFATKDKHYSLKKEFENYLYLGADDPAVVQHGIPHLMHYGDFQEYKVLVMTKTGIDLFELSKGMRHEKLNMITICKVAMQAIRIFQYIHSKGLLFIDVKPTNIAIGDTDQNQILFFDFAFSEFYVNAIGEPKLREKTDKFHGTPQYMALAQLKRLTHVRIDDFISFGIVLLELNGVILPWNNKTNSDDYIYTTMDIVLEEWEKHGIKGLVQSSDDPQTFLEYFEYFDSLREDEDPDYDAIYDIFASKLTAEELKDRNLFNISDYYYEDNIDTGPVVQNTPVHSGSHSLLSEEDLRGIVIDERFLVGEHLGKGTSGFVRSAVDLTTDDEVAIKFVELNDQQLLNVEYDNYMHLGANDPNIVQYGIPHIIHFADFRGYKILTMTKTGPTLSILRRKTKTQQFGLKTICKIAIQAIRIFEYIHGKDLVLQDVNPLNMAIDNSNGNRIFFFDFSSSGFYVDSQGEPLERQKSEQSVGTPDYMSWAVLNGFKSARKDDLISFGIVLLRLSNAFLPWMDKTSDEDAIEIGIKIVREEWDKHGIEGICLRSDHPQLFMDYFNYLISISARDRPDYDWLIELFSRELPTEDLANHELGIFDSDAE